MYRTYSNKRRRAYLISCATSAALIRGRRFFQTLYQTNLLLLYFYSTVHFLSVNFTREIHAVKKTWEFHDNESKNISGESIESAVLIQGRRLLTFLSQMRRLFEGGV